MAPLIQTEENMVKLRNLDEDSIQENLHNRFKQDQIYTYVGTVLIAINPFRMLPLYTPDVLERYHENGALGQAPHTYAIADNAYRNLIRDWKDQSIVVSGESGAGKTETTKQVLEYLTEMSNAVHPMNGGAAETPLEDQCISAQVILEAFGNAKTVRNDNSSRYGKWMQIIFGRAGNIKGAVIQTYLLEKSRVITLDPGERSYHVFYQLCAAAQNDTKLFDKLLFKHAGGANPRNFAYLATSNTYECAGIKDGDEFDRLKAALAAFDIKDEDADKIFRLVAAIMHLGNVKFKAQVQRKLGCDVDGCAVQNKPALEAAATLLGLQTSALETALIERNYTTGGETAVIPRPPAEADDARDALSKALYAALFSYLRNQINVVLGRRGLGEEKDRRQIGVLDIFGFEILQTNSFEQLCINFCNEKLQSHFNEECFRIEQAEYKAEGIDVIDVAYQDNTPCLELLENKPNAGGKPGGIFPMIEEELTTPGGSNKMLLEKLSGVHKKHPNFAQSAKDGPTTFKVKHYAGEVLYKVDGLIEKSRDLLHNDLEVCLNSSSDQLVKDVMAARVDETPANAAPSRGPARQKLTAPSLGAQFTRQLNALMSNLHATQPHFIKCIKPNPEKRGGLYIVDDVLTQLRYTGIFGLCKLRQAGYSERPTLEEFFGRYRVMCRPWPKDVERLVSELSQRGFLKPKMWVKGKTKMMLKHEQATELEVALQNRRNEASGKIGRAVRRFNLRKIWVLVCQTRKTAKAAIKQREMAALDKAMDLLEQLPDSGMWWPEKQLIVALKERLRQEAEATVLLKKAIEARDISALEAALKVSDNLEMETPEVKKARELLESMREQVAAREALRVLLKEKAPTRAQLEPAILRAEQAGIGEYTETKEARAILQRLIAEEEANKAYDVAKAANDLAAIDTALARFTELGLQLPKGAKAARDAIVQRQARDKQEKDVRDHLTRALNAKDVEDCEAALQRALELGVTGREADNARKFVKENQERLEAMAHAKAQADIFDGKMHSAVGLTEQDVQEMSAALKRAEAAGARSPAGDRNSELDVAKQTMDRANQAIKARDALRQAIQLRDYDKIQAALDNARKLELNVPELEEAKALLKQLEAAPLPAAVATGTMAQILDISRGARWRFEKFGGLRPQERFAKGRLMLASTKKKVQEGMLTYTKEVIPRSLLDIESSLAKQAVQCHKCLLGFCGDRKTTYPAAAGHHILMTGVQSVELRDEILIQICKHLTGNPDMRSMTRGWLLMCLCVDLFPPSVKFELYLLNFLGTAANDKTFGEYARYSLARLEEALDLDEAALENLVLERGLPSVEFIWHVLSQQSNPFRVSQIIPHRRPWQDSRK